MAVSLRRRLGIAAIAGSLLLTAACTGTPEEADDTGEPTTSPTSTSEPEAPATGADASIWVTIGTDEVLQASVDAWNAEGGAQLDLQFFENDPYKQKLRTSISAGEGPTIFSGWGGGGLREYVEAGEVHSLQADFDAAPELRDRIFPSVLAGGTIDGEIYGTPYNGVQPVVIYYNKDVFAQTGVEVPTTWGELLVAVEDLNAAGVAPFTVGGASRWPYLMWIAYLTDRIGGPEVFDAVVAGEPGAWLDPAIVQAAGMIQDLVEAGGFVDGFSSVDANQGAAEALLYTGAAAMHLQGAWAYSGTYLTAAEDFVTSGSLGWTTFPAVEGGAGDPTNVTGNLSTFFSITRAASDEEKATATQWLLTRVFDDEYVDHLMETGAVPPISGLEDKIAASSAPEWNEFVYKTAEAAGNFQLSWDQALDAEQADALLTNLERVFLLEITPEDFAANLDQVASQG